MSKTTIFILSLTLGIIGCGGGEKHPCLSCLDQCISDLVRHSGTVASAKDWCVNSVCPKNSKGKFTLEQCQKDLTYRTEIRKKKK